MIQPVRALHSTRAILLVVFLALLGIGTPLALWQGGWVTQAAKKVGIGRSTSITWERDFEKALERAGAEKKLIIADMFTDWCVLCKKMDAETFADPQLIRNMADDYVWLKLNTETEEDGIRLQKEFAITNYPAIFLLDGQGQEIDRIEQFLPPQQFTETFESFIDSPTSLASMRKAAQEQSNSVSARFALAERFLKQNNFPKASVEFKKVVELDPENREGKTVDSHYNVALCLASQQKFDEAIAELDLLETHFPKSQSLPDVAVLRGQIYHCCGKFDKAQAILEEYVQKYPTHAHVEEARQLLAQLQAISRN